ncbi:hypothetical protein JCM3766R1_004164 [Sporobolomyces carnicolor]
MKLSLSILALFVASTSVSAACHRRRSTIPVAASNAADVDRRAIDPMVSTPREVVRRHKGGRRLERRGPPAQGNGGQQQGGRGQQGQGQGQRGQQMQAQGAESRASSMTSAAASQQTSSKSSKPSSSSASKAAGGQATQSSSSATAQSTSSSSSSSSSSGTYTGEATFYYQNGVAGACGSVSSDSDKVVALQTSMYGSGGYCGETITITNTANGKSTTATVADECPSCSGSSSIDLSTGAFDAIGHEDTGVLSVSWSFN